ncbi:MAG: DUF4422 domain-containing protein [Phocaeicola sp.]
MSHKIEKKPVAKILVCCHKEDQWASDEVYMPIQVGRAISQVKLPMQGDDTGEHMSHKNRSYCELTGIYWAWKNLKGVDYIGLSHYRRYFNFNSKGTPFMDYTPLKGEHFDKMDLTTPKMEELFKGCDVVLAKPKHYSHNLSIDYGNNHVSDDLRTLREVVHELTPQYEEALNWVLFNNNKLAHYNMFLMKWEEFDRYCNWLFTLLEETERRIDTTHYSDTQKRIWGYLGERLLNVYVKQRGMRVGYYPIYWITEDTKIKSYWQRMRRHWRTNWAFKLS